MIAVAVVRADGGNQSSEILLQADMAIGPASAFRMKLACTQTSDSVLASVATTRTTDERTTSQIESITGVRAPHLSSAQLNGRQTRNLWREEEENDWKRTVSQSENGAG